MHFQQSTLSRCLESLFRLYFSAVVTTRFAFDKVLCLNVLFIFFTTIRLSAGHQLPSKYACL